MDFLSLIQGWDLQIRKGQISAVKEDISKLNSSKIPRAHRHSIANLLRRVGANQFALRIITPTILYKDSSLRSDVKDLEIAEYAVLLQRIGLPKQALKKLARVNSADHPKALLYQAYCHFNQWDYDLAVPLLKDYVKSDGLLSYDRLIGEVNLLASLVTTQQLREAEELAQKLIKLCEQGAYARLHTNCLELLAQIYIQKNAISLARETLNESESIARNNSSIDQLFLEKWKAFLNSYEKKNLDDLLLFRERAKTSGHWESVRETDYLSLKVVFDQKVFNRVLYGSSYKKYHLKLLHEFQRAKDTPKEIVIGNQEKVIDLYRGTFGEDELVPPGRTLHQLLNGLFFDLYKPMRIGSIFSTLYADETFNIFSSPNRVHQIVLKLRQHLQARGNLIHIKENHGNYQAYCDKKFGFYLRLEKTMPTPNILYIDQLRSSSKGPTLTRTEITNTLKLPRTSATRFINDCLKQGKLLKIGSGPQTKYQITTPSHSIDSKKVS